MIKNHLKTHLSQVVETLVKKNLLPEEILTIPVEIDVPKDSSHGDFMTNLALTSSKATKSNPRATAEFLVSELLANTEVFSSVTIAGPGFINFVLNPNWVANFVSQINHDSSSLRPTLDSDPQRINVEFVSVNPNGPITIGSGRGAAFGSALCNVLEAAGNQVHREYYINDGVNSEQMRLFAESVKAIVEERPVPDNGYKGDYVHDVAQRLTIETQSWIDFFEYRMRLIDQEYDSLKSETEQWMPNNFGMPDYIGKFGQEMFDSVKERNAARGEFLMQAKNSAYDAAEALKNNPNDRPLATVKNLGYEPTILDWQQLSQVMMLAKQKEDLSRFQVNFDTWFSEQSLHNSGQVFAELVHLLEIGTADTKPTRTKLITGKGGVIQEVQIEDQTVNTDEEDLNASVGESADESETLWLRSTKFGDDQDRVLRRKDGRLTYIASDIAYHKDKFNRPENADKLITVLGPDHHGYIGRLQAVVAAMILDDPEVQSIAEKHDSKPLDEFESKIYASPKERDLCQAALQIAKQRLEVQIFQIVRFMKDGKPAPMRKRDGNIYALIDLINEIGETLLPNGTTEQKQQAGSDVARFFYLMRHHDTAMDFDLELATKQSDENPVFYVQYAHARICSILEKAQEVLGASFDPQETNVDYSLLIHDRERALIIKMCDLPNEIERIANDYSVNRLTTYAIELARTYHHFYDACRVLQGDQPELSRARLSLCLATKTTLAEVFKLIGISAPTSM